MIGRVSEALEEKRENGGNARWSSFRLVLLLMTVAWVIRFLVEPVGYIISVFRSDTLVPIPTLGPSMAWIGGSLILAACIRPWMDKTDPKIVVDMIHRWLDQIQTVARKVKTD